jgi:hypothetical protein
MTARSARPASVPSWAAGYLLEVGVEGIWSVLKRGVLGNLAVASFTHLVQVIRHGPKKIQYRPAAAGGPYLGPPWAHAGGPGVRPGIRADLGRRAGPREGRAAGSVLHAACVIAKR